jgi:hypothetical protein
MAEDKKDFLHGDSDTFFSLSKLVGKKIADITGYPTDPFGGTPVFKLHQIVFEDGTTVYAEGEHDVPYIPSDEELKNMDESTLKALC